ncbi:hypothetical protein ACH475_16125 [Streptomyces globisporus]|uniref:hypothetical protein n=2 Tax=Streptomyces globisporus TaxID=1908 RepID=UPI0037A73234
MMAAAMASPPCGFGPVADVEGVALRRYACLVVGQGLVQVNERVEGRLGCEPGVDLRFLAAVHAAGGPVARRRMKAVEVLATLVEHMPALRSQTPRQDDDTTPLPARQTRAAAVAAVGAVLGLVDS